MDCNLLSHAFPVTSANHVPSHLPQPLELVFGSPDRRTGPGRVKTARDRFGCLAPSRSLPARHPPQGRSRRSGATSSLERHGVPGTGYGVQVRMPCRCASSHKKNCHDQGNMNEWPMTLSSLSTSTVPFAQDLLRPTCNASRVGALLRYFDSWSVMRSRKLASGSPEAQSLTNRRHSYLQSYTIHKIYSPVNKRQLNLQGVGIHGNL